MLFYIMSPYTGNRFEMFHRHLVTSFYCSRLSQEGIPLISPIMHWHFSAHVHSLPHDADYWGQLNYHIFSACEAGIVLMQEGWEESKGVAEEILWHQEHKKPIYYLDLEGEVADGKIEQAIVELVTQLREDWVPLREVPASATVPLPYHRKS